MTAFDTQSGRSRYWTAGRMKPFDRLLDLLNPLALLADVRVRSNGIQFVLLRLVVIATVPFENIEAVETQWKWISRWSAYRFINRCGPKYLINKKSAWFSKYVVVSPADPDEFEAELRQHGVLVKKAQAT